MLRRFNDWLATRSQKKQLIAAFKLYQAEALSLHQRHAIASVDLTRVEKELMKIRDKVTNKPFYASLLQQKFTLAEKLISITNDIAINQQWQEKLTEQYKLLLMSKTAETTAKALAPTTLRNVEKNINRMIATEDIAHDVRNEILDVLKESTTTTTTVQQLSIQAAVQEELDKLNDEEEMKVQLDLDKLDGLELEKKDKQQHILSHPPPQSLPSLDPALEEHRNYLANQLELEKNQLRQRRQQHQHQRRLTSSISVEKKKKKKEAH